MKLYRIVITLLILCTCITMRGLSQTSEQAVAIKVLQIGDQCPDFIFENLINSDKAKTKLSDYSGKLVIIDFWATWCGPCLSALPKLNELQQQFPNEIVILPVTYENAEKVRDTFRDKEELRKITLPIVTSNTMLKQYFPHRTIPHEVWIDGNGKVLSITSEKDVTPANIKQYLTHRNVGIHQKKDILDKDLKKPFLLGALGSYKLDPGNVQYSTIITGPIEGMSSVSICPGVYDTYAKMSVYNFGVTGLYQWAFGTSLGQCLEANSNFNLTMPARTLWEASDTTIYSNFGKNKQIKELPYSKRPYFCFEIIVPSSDARKLNTIAVEELNKFFNNKYGIEGVKEKRKMLCWILYRTDSVDRLRSLGGKSDISMTNGKKLVLANKTVTAFLYLWFALNLSGTKIPVVDETGYSGNIDLSIEADLKDIPSVSKALEKYGLALKKEVREIDMVIIRDKKQ